MKRMSFFLLVLGVIIRIVSAETAAIPTFTGIFSRGGRQYSYRVVGRKPDLGGTTTIPTVLVPVALSFRSDAGFVLNPTPEIAGVLHSPIFEPAAFATGNTQYGDAVLRAQF